MKFKDHFSIQSVDYAKYRPTYPQELFDFLASMVETKDTCWDVGTGNGQAAVELAKFFKNVIASDPSEAQISSATQADNIEYLVCPAEETPLPSHSINLITVAQAYHWFNHEQFTAEAKRVSKPGAIIAVWGYEISQVNPAVDAVFMKYYEDILGEYWPKERKHVEARYSSLPFPFKDVLIKEFQLLKNWDLQDYMNYLSTWSAFQKYVAAKAENPLDLVREEFYAAWGNPEEKKNVVFPVFLKLGTIE